MTCRKQTRPSPLTALRSDSMKTAQTGMHSLPPELNEHIALCCAEQNALLWSALQDLGFDEEDSQATDAAAGPTRYDTLRRTVIANRSLTALAAVSHEWNDLAAPFLFEVRLSPREKEKLLRLKTYSFVAFFRTCPSTRSTRTRLSKGSSHGGDTISSACLALVHQKRPRVPARSAISSVCSLSCPTSSTCTHPTSCKTGGPCCCALCSKTKGTNQIPTS
jgi:hypothetical protein